MKIKYWEFINSLIWIKTCSQKKKREEKEFYGFLRKSFFLFIHGTSTLVLKMKYWVFINSLIFCFFGSRPVHVVCLFPNKKYIFMFFARINFLYFIHSTSTLVLTMKYWEFYNSLNLDKDLFTQFVNLSFSTQKKKTCKKDKYVFYLNQFFYFIHKSSHLQHKQCCFSGLNS